MILTTKCTHCAQNVPFKHNNSPDFWYCNQCKGPIHLSDLSQLKSDTRGLCTTQFPKATHFVLFSGIPKKPEGIVIEAPSVSKNMTQKEGLESATGALVYGHNEYLGKVYF